MKLVMLTLFFLGSHAYGQRPTLYMFDEALRKGDSLEVMYKNDSLLKIIIDTLPLYTLDYDSGWRDMELVAYFYKNTNDLKKIVYRNGREGDYYFYFEGNYLRKVRVLKYAKMINLQYYYTIDDNIYSASEIKYWTKIYPEKKELFELLITGKSFFNKFKILF